MKTFEKFIREGLYEPTGFLKIPSTHSEQKPKEVQTEDIIKLRELIKSKLTKDMYNFTFINPTKDHMFNWNFEYSSKLKTLLLSLKDKYPIIGNNLESLYYENVNKNSKVIYNEWTDKRKTIHCEKDGHRTHFASGLPNYLRGTGLGFMLYINFIKFLGYARSAGDSSTDAQNLWKKISKRSEFYAINTHTDILVIDKNIIGKQKLFNGELDKSWLYNSRNSNVYTENDVYTIIMRFMKNQNVNSLQDLSIDPELYKDLPDTKRKILNLLKFNPTEEKIINPQDLLKLKEKDFLKIILENDKEYTLCVNNIYRNDPKKPLENGEFLELSNEYMGDRYSFVINIQNNTLSKRTDDDKYMWIEKIKTIYFLGGKIK